jgi:hypothetical protein
MELPSLYLNGYGWLVIALVIWEFAWKGIAMWKAARNGDTPWFVILLVINTVGILPILYIYIFGKKAKSHKKH